MMSSFRLRPLVFLLGILPLASNPAKGNTPAPEYDDGCLPQSKKAGDACDLGGGTGSCVSVNADRHVSIAEAEGIGGNAVFRCDELGNCLRCLGPEWRENAAKELASARRLLALKKADAAEKLLFSFKPLREGQACQHQFLLARAAEGKGDFKRALDRIEGVTCEKLNNRRYYYEACYQSRLHRPEEAAGILHVLEHSLTLDEIPTEDWEWYVARLAHDPDLAELRRHEDFAEVKKRFGERLHWSKNGGKLKAVCVPEPLYPAKELKKAPKLPCKIGAFNNKFCESHYRMVWVEKLPKLGECLNDDGETEAEQKKRLED